jgi:hypothetical protein
MDLLIRSAMTENDPACRGYAYMAVSELAARLVPAAGLAGEAAERGREFLTRTVSGQRGRAERDWACLAGALCLGTDQADRPEREALAAELIKIARHENDASTRSAALLSLGLLREEEAIPVLREALIDRSAPVAAGYAGLALGLLGDRTVSAPLRQLMAPGGDPATRERAATALALLSPEMAGSVLERLLQDAATVSEAVWAAQNLGRVGTPTALPPLVRLAADETAPTLSRAFALVGLGRLLEPDVLPWNTRLATGCDYFSLGPAETALLDIY